jgi:hypothetical protein
MREAAAIDCRLAGLVYLIVVFQTLLYPLEIREVAQGPFGPENFIPVLGYPH